MALGHLGSGQIVLRTLQAESHLVRPHRQARHAFCDRHGTQPPEPQLGAHTHSALLGHRAVPGTVHVPLHREQQQRRRTWPGHEQGRGSHEHGASVEDAVVVAPVGDAVER